MPVVVVMVVKTVKGDKNNPRIVAWDDHDRNAVHLYPVKPITGYLGGQPEPDPILEVRPTMPL